MIFKTIIVFLLVMVVIGMVGSALFPGALSKAAKRKRPLAGTCPKCGRYLIGKSGCDCGPKG